MHSASLPHRPAAPTGPQHFVATAGYGGDDWAANIYSPQKINIYAGDSVTWTNRGRLEPHTISFGSMPLLRKLAQQLVQVAPQKAGPPQLSFNSQAAFPTRAATYDGTGFANSGLLQQGQRWTIRFTRPGTYKYHCLIHFPGMTGTVVVHPRPAGSRSYTVLTGYGSGNSAADVFFPDTLTVHVGSTVTWKHAFFHTVTFASVNTIRRLRKEFIVPVPQKGGPPKLTINPAVAFPAGGTVESGIPMLSSGILQPPHSKFSVTFTKPGVYHYACLVHFGMDGTIRVIK
ncbi:MAG: cupredoxin domain-containing protein [Chloroflexota bacterium]